MSYNSRFWDRISKILSIDVKGAGQTELYTINRTLEFVNYNSNVLDFGCGPGSITIKLANHIEQIYAIDTSSGMVKKANQRKENLKLGNVRFENISIFDSKLDGHTFDAILMFNVFHYLENPELVLKRMKSLLKPNGILLSATACLKESKSGIAILMKILTGIRLVPGMKFYSKANLSQLLEKDHQFEIIEIEEISKLPDVFIAAKNPAT